MGENDALKMQDIIQAIGDLIDHKDCQIARWTERTKEEYEKGFARGVEEGMNKAWAVAEAIVHLRWDGAYVPPQTVEEWFEKYSAQEAVKMLEHCRERMREKPYWKILYEKNRCVCSRCKQESEKESLFCPNCGAEMKGETEVEID